MFRLSDYGIITYFRITNVSFGVQTVNSTFPAEVHVYNWTVGTLPTGTATFLGNPNVAVGVANNAGLVNTGTALTTTVAAGSTFVVETYHDRNVEPPQSF